MLSSTNSSSENTNQFTVVPTKKQKVISELTPIGLSLNEKKFKNMKKCQV